MRINPTVTDRVRCTLSNLIRKGHLSSTVLDKYSHCLDLMEYGIATQVHYDYAEKVENSCQSFLLSIDQQEACR